jgi:hypothetical protein
MTEQVEVVYEDGVLRPMRQLPFAEKQHLIVTVSGDAGAPAAHNPRTREFEWLRVHSPAHAGRWVALEGDRLVGEGDNLKSVLEQARAKGVSRPLVHHIPKEPSLPFAGW